MYSKTLELSGLGLIAWGLAWLLSVPAGIIFAGVAIFCVGGVTDDAAVGMTFRRSVGWARYAWHRQLLREDGYELPSFRSERSPGGLVACDCGGDPDCPLCVGLGYVPDPAYRENPRSPHPPLRVDPDAEKMSATLARVRQERAKNGSRA